METVNNPPVAFQIQNQTIDEGNVFEVIKLDDFVTDLYHAKEQISWETDIQPAGKDQTEGDLSV